MIDVKLFCNKIFKSVKYDNFLVLVPSRRIPNSGELRLSQALISIKEFENKMTLFHKFNVDIDTKELLEDVDIV
jgi:hypothetical protein